MEVTKWLPIHVFCSRSLERKLAAFRSACGNEMISASPSTGSFLRGLTIDQLGDLESYARSYSCPQGTLLFSEGELPQSAFILLEGQVTLSVNSTDGKRLIIGIAKAGEVLGLASVLNGGPYEMATETQYTCKVCTIDRAEFLRFLLRHTSALQNAALALCQSYNQACTRFRTLSGCPTGKAKIARLLLEFANASCQDGTTHFLLALNHQEIGDWVGMSRESVSRVLSSFRRVKLIAQKGACLAITDRSSLERFAAARRPVRMDDNGKLVPHLEGADDKSIDHMIERVTAVLQRHKIRLPRLRRTPNHGASSAAPATRKVSILKGRLSESFLDS
jgi:CRP/FNR family transcriptional regulator, cyclic AMP receptor protein